MFEIYKITCNINNKVYIGITSNGVENRWKQHIRAAYNTNHKDANSVFKKAIRKYKPENFEIKIIDIANSAEEAEEKEIHYIGLYNSFAFDKNSNGYNSTRGGDGVKGYGTISIVEIDIKSGMIINEYNSLKEAEENYGHRINHIYDLSSKISTTLNTFFMHKDIALKFTKADLKEKVYQCCDPIVQLDLSGNFIDIWANIKQIVDALHFSQGNISEAILGNRRLANNYMWITYNEFKKEKNITLRKIKTTATPVLQYSIDGILVNKYNSIIEAEKMTGISNSKITMVCKHKRNHAGGYIWCYEGQEINTDAVKSIKTRNKKLTQRKQNRIHLKSRNISNIIEINTGKTFLSISEISDITGISRKVIREVLVGKREEYKGHKWQYIDKNNT